MASLTPWTFLGGKTTVVQGLDSGVEWSVWESRVVRFVSGIDESPDFEITDNGYRSFAGVLVTKGVTGFFRGKRFEMWSDMPGELIFRHHSMGARVANELIRRLEELWV